MRVRIKKITLALTLIIIIILLATFLILMILAKNGIFGKSQGDINQGSQVSSTKEIDKSCRVIPPLNSLGRTVNTKGKSVDVPSLNISESMAALESVVGEAQKWSADSKIIGMYGQPRSIYADPQGNPDRAHFGEEKGSMYSWTVTAYSKEKKQSADFLYADRQVSLVGIIDEAQRSNELDGLQGISGNLIPSCKVYEIAQKQNLDEEANYYTIKLNPGTSESVYKNRTVWILQERSRRESNVDSIGDLKYSYYIDAQTGEFLSKKEGI